MSISANADLAEILGIVLLVLGSDLTWLVVIFDFLEEAFPHMAWLHARTRKPPRSVICLGESLEVGARLGGWKTKPLQHGDVGFGAMTLVAVVRDGYDFVKSKVLAEFVLSAECGLHDADG